MLDSLSQRLRFHLVVRGASFGRAFFLQMSVSSVEKTVVIVSHTVFKDLFDGWQLAVDEEERRRIESLYVSADQNCEGAAVVSREGEEEW